ncbi:MAG: Phosphate ABC transporter, periplasmic phosphate-binding protein PstS [uncultured Phycisphaerae bacterium]|uniref:Phosphate-binding protein n=1 Tax=uncultured Phycisphaerae bacterium TaxID=904963 RepID=A0A6J4PCD5_9BACT|nr:MAG: Phosphate ABC transporter, periplasmic phosphate-binding protein PstS [uncultured Phycisphaerae bacterium]
MRTRTMPRLLLATAILAAATLGCDRGSSSSTTSPSSSGQVGLTGAGATFPKPLYEKWAAEYTKMRPNVQVNYQGIGSGGGIKQITDRTVDFGATDGPMTDDQLAKAPGPILHIPMTLGAVVPIYNLPQAAGKPLVFGGPVLADLFLGRITKWNDPKLAQLNPGVSLPDKAITIVHRSDGSGTTYIFADYLSKVSKDWAAGPGRATTLNWPVGRGAKGNDGVAADVKQNEGSLGYVELIYAANNAIAYGDVQSAAGKPVHATPESVSAAAAAFKEVPDDLRFSITNPEGDAAYPISSLTWILVYRDQPDAAKGKALLDFLWWATHDGQPMAGALSYAPLPATLVPRIEQKLKSVTAGGKPIMGQ